MNLHSIYMGPLWLNWKQVIAANVSAQRASFVASSAEACRASWNLSDYAFASSKVTADRGRRCACGASAVTDLTLAGSALRS